MRSGQRRSRQGNLLFPHVGAYFGLAGGALDLDHALPQQRGV